MKDPLLLIIDGMDRVGKTSLINTIDKKTNYKHLILDRGPLSYRAYSEIYNKKTSFSQYNTLEDSLKKVPHLCVYLYASLEELEKRFIKTNELFIETINDHLKIFKKYYTKCSLKKISIDTTNTESIEVYKKLIKQIGEI